MAVDNRTESRDYALPDPTNDLSEDVSRLIAALGAIDADVAALILAVAAKSALGHGHTIEEITGLVSALAAKAASNHQHTLNDLSDVSVSGATNGQVVKKVGDAWSPATLGISDVTGLQAALDDSTLPEHSHAISGVTGLQAALDAKASISHTHSIANVTGLQDALDGKSASSHNHDDRYYTESEVTAALSGKSNTGHGHTIEEIDGLEEVLEGFGDVFTVIDSTEVSTAVSFIEFAGTWNYSILRVEGLTVSPSSNSPDLKLQISDDNGSTWQTLTGTVPSPADGLLVNSFSTAAQSATFSFDIKFANTTSHRKVLLGWRVNASGNVATPSAYSGIMGAVNKVRLVMTSGNIDLGTVTISGANL